ncbi:ExbD/TolR family protein [Lutibaculum baratangense]|uniref:Biopolymer transport protein ExbD/TolR n=1 Tax=Lutibaculum baratangense AMV1 TaxID=631454 RepID=V4RKZ8_9HYPH|nr:biopolymer transporter ExbD [Lutibaculum baratangense]ESR23885.1 Biopolymer transport protein ExbD/TolR [Lutibaculum baratangense AMV1]
MRFDEPPARRLSDEGVVPLINVVFLLLIFFLIAGTMTPPSPVELDPVTTRESPAARSPAAVLFVSGDGRMAYRARPVTVSELSGIVRADDERDRGQPLSVMLDRELPSRELALILDALARGGVSNLRLVTLRGRGE